MSNPASSRALGLFGASIAALTACGSSQATVPGPLDSLSTCAVSGGFAARPLGGGAVTPEEALARWLAAPIEGWSPPASGWTRHTESADTVVLVNPGGRYEVKVVRDPDGTWAVDSGRGCLP